MRKGKLLLPLLAMFLIVACSKGIEGTYAPEPPEASSNEEGGLFKSMVNSMAPTYTFDSNGKVIVNIMGTNQEMDYTIDGDKIKIKSPTGTVVLMRQKDGSLVGPMDTKLIKQKP